MISVSRLVCSQTNLQVWGKFANKSAFVLSAYVCCLFKGARLVCFISSVTVNTPCAIHI